WQLRAKPPPCVKRRLCSKCTFFRAHPAPSALAGKCFCPSPKSLGPALRCRYRRSACFFGNAICGVSLRQKKTTLDPAAREINCCVPASARTELRLTEAISQPQKRKLSRRKQPLSEPQPQPHSWAAPAVGAPLRPDPRSSRSGEPLRRPETRVR